MNKKILLLLIACVISAIAFKVFAGTAGGPAGACGIPSPECSAIPISTISFSQSTIQANLTSYMSNISTITVTAFCGNATPGNPCFNSSVSAYNQSNCSGIVTCDSETDNYLIQNITGNFSNITGLSTIIGSTFLAYKAPTLQGIYVLTPGGWMVTLASNIGTVVDVEFYEPEDVNLLGIAITGFDPVAQKMQIALLEMHKNTGVIYQAVGIYPSSDAIGPVPDSLKVVSNKGTGTDYITIAYKQVNLLSGEANTIIAGINVNTFDVDATGREIFGFTVDTMVDLPNTPIQNEGGGDFRTTALTGRANDGTFAQVNTKAGPVDPGDAKKSDVPAASSDATKDITGNYLLTGLGASPDFAIYNAASIATMATMSINSYTAASFDPAVMKLVRLPSGAFAAYMYDSATDKFYVAFVNSNGQIIGNVAYGVNNIPNAVLTQVKAVAGSAIGILSNGTDTIGLVARGTTLVSAFSVPNLNGWDVDVVARLGSEGHAGSAVEFLITGTDPTNNTIILDYFNTSMDASAINPNGTMRFTTDKIVAIQTMAPDIDILNFQLRWQNFSGSFDTTRGECIGCKYDLSNATCQAEVEKIWGMFLSYNITINLTMSTPINLSSLNLICRSIFDAQAYAQAGTPPANCTGLSQYGIDANGNCYNPIAGVPGSYLGSNGVVIPMNGTTGLAGSIGTISPNANCEQIACEVNGTWTPGNDQEFTINKTITVTAI